MHLKIISAGAGSGKTYRLTQEMVQLLQQGVRPEGIIATTFTKKAASELQERVRVKLLKEGMTQQAEALSSAMIGTVHSLGVKLLQRFAYEAGVSPEVAIVAEEDQQTLFNLSLATTLTEERVETMERYCEQLGLSAQEKFDWRREVRNLTEIARANDFSPEILEKSAQQSFSSLLPFLDAPDAPAAAHCQETLPGLLQETIERLRNNGDSTKVTKEAADSLQQLSRELQLRGKLYWRSWAQLSKVTPGAKSKADMETLWSLAERHLAFPEFHADIQGFITELFALAIAAMREYADYKKKRGLIDYTDMETLVKKLLDRTDVRQVLQDELDLLLVDEFQDTSPIQLEIFLKLSRLSKYSIWVGDPKQSIYGFRGAAPELMQAIIDKTGGIRPEDIQSFSWRSREDIVHMVNALFTKAFPKLPPEQIALQSKRLKAEDPIEMDNALHIWKFDLDPEEKQKNSRTPGKPWLENCIAFSLREFLDNRAYIRPKGMQNIRLAKPGDVAILCRSNDECSDMAEALHQAGFRVSISRTGLMQTAEARLMLACLKYLLHQKDTLSIAEILLLAENQPIEEIITERLDYLEAYEQGQTKNRWGDNHPMIRELNRLRPRVAELSCAETLDLLLGELDLRRIIATLGKTQQRLDNVEVFRKLAAQYEDSCNRLQAAASLGGFLLWLNRLEASGQDFQSSGEHPDAVNVLTYHRSKGLEWPIVICHSLEKKQRADIWGVDIVAETSEPDLDNLLGNRHLRYWPNPYGNPNAKTTLLSRIQESAVYTQKRQQSLEEEHRLLYVGLTRARDYLILPIGLNPTRWLNRTWHDGNEELPVLDPETPETPWEWEGRYITAQIRKFEYPRQFAALGFEEAPSAFIAPPGGQQPHPPLFIDLRLEKWPLPYKPRTEPPLAYAPPLLPRGTSDEATAKAAKAFLNAVYPDYPETEILEIAETIIRNYALDEVLQAPDFQALAATWMNELATRFPAQKAWRRFPLRQETQGRVFETTVDLLLQTPDGWVLIQHSGFAGDAKSLPAKALELASWRHLCLQSLQSETAGAPVRTFIHFVLHQTLIEIL